MRGVACSRTRWAGTIEDTSTMASWGIRSRCSRGWRGCRPREGAPMKESEHDYLFEQFRVERGCLHDLVADPETRQAALVDPELEDGGADAQLRLRARPQGHLRRGHPHPRRPLLRRARGQGEDHREDRHAQGGPGGLRGRQGRGRGPAAARGSPLDKFLHTPGHAKDLVSGRRPAEDLGRRAAHRTRRPDRPAERQRGAGSTTRSTIPTAPSRTTCWSIPGHDYEEGASTPCSGRRRRSTPR